MADFLGHFVPHLPPTHDALYHLLALAVVGLVKVYRGRTMHYRARRIDFFGWTIIAFDYIFGAILLIATIWTIYPRLHNRWFDLVTTTVLLVIALLQGYTVHEVPPHRIERAMRPTQNDPPNEERRSGLPGRRAEDILAYSSWKRENP